ncbi:MAG: sugar transferase [Bacteroidales bacterium]|nr:sugar transferase [Bacteroidales bacterium]
MNKFKQTLKYVLSDVIAAGLAWTLFFFFRKIYIESKYFGEVYLSIDSNFYLGITLIPLSWLLIYYISGYYYDIYRKSRLKEISQTFSMSLFGVLIIFFKLILDDIITSYNDYYQSLLFLFLAHFLLTYIPRVFITSNTIKKIHSKKIGFPTLLVGSNGQAAKIFREIEDMKKSPGNKFVGFVNIYNHSNPELEVDIPCLGKYEDLPEIINKNKIEEVIIAIESSEHNEIKDILSKLLFTNVRVKILPSLYDIISGYVTLVTLYKTPLIEIHNRRMSVSQENLKRIIDVSLSLLAVIILIPVYFVVALGVKLSSKGPVFYKQERVGKNSKPFKIIKFRSMFIDAEKDGPALSSSSDSRITPFGKFMRKTRLDEIPQFFNVIFGEMALVGPRPERQFYIDLIVPQAPFYMSLLRVKPGITSLGQVKYGYAENVEQMIERMKYDLVYLQNMSIYLDFKIMILTVKTVFEASGK